MVDHNVTIQIHMLRGPHIRLEEQYPRQTPEISDHPRNLFVLETIEVLNISNPMV